MSSTFLNQILFGVCRSDSGPDPTAERESGDVAEDFDIPRFGLSDKVFQISKFQNFMDISATPQEMESA